MNARATAWLAAAAAALAVLCVVSPQRALGLTEVSAIVNAAGNHSATAECPAGMHIVSGGGWAQVIPATLGQPPLNGSQLSANGWTATGYSYHDPTDPFNVTAYAYCGPHDLHLATFTNSATGTPRVRTPVACGAGTVVSGGGLVTGSYGLAFVNAMSGNGWELGADARYDGGAMIPTTTQAEVYCTSERFELTTATATGVAAGNHILDLTATCPNGTVLASGGGDAGESGLIWYSRMQGNGWIIRANNLSASTPTNITAYAHCIRLPETTITRAKIKSRPRKAKLSFTGSGGEGSLSFECKLDKKPFKACGSPRTYKRLKVRKHVFRVAAKDAAGQLDPAPAIKRFRIKRIARG